MTMYKENEVLFIKTMNAVIENIAYLCRDDIWGHNGWKEVVVCIVSDGRNMVHKRTLQVLSVMGCYQDGITVDAENITAHIFEYTSKAVVIETELATEPVTYSFKRGTHPVQILFCLKEKNQKKLNSHRWFFNAFCPLIKPEVCILLDVGTKPTSTSIYELWKCFDNQPNVGGACGELCVDTGPYCKLLLTSPLAASQNFEYKISNVLDKPLESVFGYITVLPGAFSAYRYRALLNSPYEPEETSPLASYFDSEGMQGNLNVGLFKRNMYLAEDRILCFELVTKRGQQWILKYVKSAKASTDVPTSVAEFILQRRRWLNGSLFVSIHATVFWFRIWSSGHSVSRKIVLQLEFIYNLVQLFFTWTLVANFYIAFFFIVGSATANQSHDAFGFLSTSAGVGKDMFEVSRKLYISLLFVVTVCSLGNRPHGFKPMYIATIVLFGLCNIITVWCMGFTVYWSVASVPTEERDHLRKLFETSTTFRDIVISILATYGIYFISSFVHMEPWHMFTSFIQYMFFLPSYVNILMIYAMCNLHDVTWGTKGDNSGGQGPTAAKPPARNGDADRPHDEGTNQREHDHGGAPVELPARAKDVDQLWDESCEALKKQLTKEKQRRDDATKQNDHDRNSRTYFVLAWVGTNALMIVVFTSTAFTNFVAKYEKTGGGSQFNPYLQFLFFSLVGLSAIRFTGSFLYLAFQLYDVLSRKFKKWRQPAPAKTPADPV
ncbi:glycosyltransferase family 2 protein [Mycena galericulata]|nr:glycosyltransferase family 2 protein [Mycena galericulata]